MEGTDALRHERPAEATITRRKLFSWIGWGSLMALTGGLAQTFVRFFKPRVLYEPLTYFKAGYPEDYLLGTVSTKWKKEQRVWIVHDEKGYYALLARCTHLGCTPNWFEEEGRFMCPCHGSNFSREGDVIAGPAPKPLYRASIRLTEDGQILVDKARTEHRPDLRERDEFLLKA